MASLYLHIPFCEHKCIYCDFYSIEKHDEVDQFLAALKREITMYSDYVNKEKFETIFFGGGTPSLLTPKSISDILELLHKTFHVVPEAEITLEANPGTVDRTKLEVYRTIGINRLSFGVQSFHYDDLRFLTRIHSAEQAKECIRLAHDVGFENVGLDLIFALPNQSIQRWEENLFCAIKLQPEHISAYSLIVEQETPLSRMIRAKRVFPLPCETEAEMYEFTMAYLRANGYKHYEVSNYALPGFESKHNSNYWNHTNYLGFGPSAHSFWSRRRWWNSASLRTYIEEISGEHFPIAGEEYLGDEQLLDEAVMLGLRSRGINLTRMKTDHGVDLIGGKRLYIDQLLSNQLAVLEEVTLRLTDKGFVLCDEISESLLSRLSVE